MIELPLLGMLKEGPLHGYELKHRLESIVGYFGTVSYGSLYPMLRKLEEQEYVAKSTEEQNGPSRNVYRITSSGEAHFVELMRERAYPFTLKMLFFKGFARLERRRLLEQEQSELVRKLEERRRDSQRISGGHMDRYRAALLARSIEHLERDIAWVQNLIEEESRHETTQDKQ